MRPRTENRLGIWGRPLLRSGAQWARLKKIRGTKYIKMINLRLSINSVEVGSSLDVPDAYGPVGSTAAAGQYTGAPGTPR